jgi:hypothetical protein
MEFKNGRVMNFEGAFRGMRNPLESWNKSDSYFGIVDVDSDIDYDMAAVWAEKEKPEYYGEHFGEHEDERIELENKYDKWFMMNGLLYRNDIDDYYEVAFLGPNDLDLAQRLIKAGSEHRKFLRQIFLSVDITAPIYWWKEFDTYLIGTVRNSTSTMHKLASTPITIDCFETDDINSIYEIDNQLTETLSGYDANNYIYSFDDGDTFLSDMIDFLESLRQRYLKTKDKRYWKELIRWLPESWLQTRTVTMNYENILSICKQREGHKLTEWHQFIEYAKTLPYANELLFINNN